MSTGGCGVVLWFRLSGFRFGGLPHGEKARNLFFLGCLAIGYNSSSRVSVPSSDGTAPSNLGEGAGALFGDGRVFPVMQCVRVWSR
jgi:hypothetical protein